MTATLTSPVTSGLLTYEGYMAEEEINRRYDIIDGTRHFLPNLTPLRQEVAMNVALLLRDYQRQNRGGRAMFAPRDVLITRAPLRIRQPDALFISHERYGRRTPQSVEPLDPAPELVVEVLSPSDARQMRLANVYDYCAVDVQECWLVSPQAETVEVLRLTPEGPVRAALYGAGQSVQSLTFPDLSLALEEVFRIEE